MVGEPLAQRPHGVEALALDERSARLQPLRAAGHGLLGHAQRLRQIREIQSQLQDWT